MDVLVAQVLEGGGGRLQLELVDLPLLRHVGHPPQSHIAVVPLDVFEKLGDVEFGDGLSNHGENLVAVNMLRNPSLSLAPVHSIEISIEISIFNSLDDPITCRMVSDQAGEIIDIICEDSHWLILIFLQFLDTLNRSVLVFLILRHYFRCHGGEPNFDCKVAGKEKAFNCEHDPPEDGMVPIDINYQVSLNFGEEK